MKNKIFLSLALLVAANAFIATPGIAYTLADAKRDAVTAAKCTGIVAGKTALGIATLGTAVVAGPAVASLLAATSVLSLTGSFMYREFGVNQLQTVWNEFKNINK